MCYGTCRMQKAKHKKSRDIPLAVTCTNKQIHCSLTRDLYAIKLNLTRFIIWSIPVLFWLINPPYIHRPCTDGTNIVILCPIRTCTSYYNRLWIKNAAHCMTIPYGVSVRKPIRLLLMNSDPLRISCPGAEAGIVLIIFNRVYRYLQVKVIRVPYV